MLEALINKVEALINERGSAAVLREHLDLLRTRVAQLESENAQLRSLAQQAQMEAQQRESQLRRFANDNPKGWRCDYCGAGDLARTGSEPDPVFGDLGIKRALMTCRVCNKVSGHLDD